MKTEHASQRYEISAKKQSDWFKNLTREERDEWNRKRDSGMRRQREGAQRASRPQERSKTE